MRDDLGVARRAAPARDDAQLAAVVAPGDRLALGSGGEVAVGWLQIGPRAHVPEWNNPRRASTPLADAPAQDERNWAASCFFVRKGFRGQGVTSALLDGGIDFARRSGARLLEAAPMAKGAAIVAATAATAAKGSNIGAIVSPMPSKTPYRPTPLFAASAKICAISPR